MAWMNGLIAWGVVRVLWDGNDNVVCVGVGHVELCLNVCLDCGNCWFRMTCELVCFGLECDAGNLLCLSGNEGHQSTDCIISRLTSGTIALQLAVSVDCC